MIQSFQAHSSYIYRIKQSPFNNFLVATCSDDWTVKIWNPSSNWSLIQEYTQHQSGINAIAWINNETIASGSDDKTIKIWSISTGETQKEIQVGCSVRSVELLNNGFYIAAAVWCDGFRYTTNEIKIYNKNDGSLITTLKGHTSFINDLVSLSSSLLASSSSDFTIRIWDLQNNRQKFKLSGHSQSISHLKLISSEI